MGLYKPTICEKQNRQEFLLRHIRQKASYRTPFTITSILRPAGCLSRSLRS